MKHSHIWFVIVIIGMAIIKCSIDVYNIYLFLLGALLALFAMYHQGYFKTKK